MDANLESYLVGFPGFSRSFSLNVLAYDRRFHQEYRDALNKGSLPCNRLRTLTIGDKGVGKSSTLQYLQGKVCNPNIEPQSTEGIDITTCETSECDPAWKLCSNDTCTSADDPSLSAAWCVCSGIDSLGGTLRSEEDPKSLKANSLHVGVHSSQGTTKSRKAKKGTSTHTTPEEILLAFLKLSLCMLYQMELLIPVAILFLVVPFVNTSFGVACWLSIFVSVPFFKGDFNSSFRYTTFCGIIIVADCFILTIKYDIFEGETQEQVAPWQVLLSVSVFGGYVVSLFMVSMVFGVLCGSGCRNGIVIAFCLMTHQSIAHINFKAAVAMMVGNLIGMLVLRGGFIYPSRKNIRIYSVSLLALATFIVFTQCQPVGCYMYVSNVLLGICVGFGFPYGVLRGREIVVINKTVPPYIVKKSFGLAVAAILGHLGGWNFIFREDLASIVCSVLAALGFLLGDFMVSQKITHLESKEGIPITTIRKFLIASANKDNPVTLKLHFWDNAGDSVYKIMQQFFRPAEAVYLLTFSLDDAVENEEWQLDRLRQWLFTVSAHSKIANTLVFIVGTHRDSVTKEFVDTFAARIEGNLYKDFCSMLAINGEMGPLYAVENSRPVDQDGLNLRQAIINIAKTTPHMNEQFPIRYLSILNKLKDLQTDDWIMTTRDLIDEIAEEGMTLEEFHKVLAWLHRTGDVIYRHDDHILKEFVVIIPQNLLDVLKNIVRIPSKASRRLTEADDWSALEDEGVASLKLIKSVVGSDSDTLLRCVIRLLEAYSLAIPAHSAHLLFPQVSRSDRSFPQPTELPSNSAESTTNHGLPCYFIIPSHLPEFTDDDADLWEPSEEDEEYFFDFGYVAADLIFHRLLAKCWCDRDAEARVGIVRHKTPLN